MISRCALAWSVLVLSLLAALTARLLIGSTGFGWPEGDNAGFFLDERLQRLAVAAIVGASLAISGVALQALLRNPLAEPYILGLSTGAGLGIMLQGYLVIQLGVSLGTSSIGAAIGTAVTLLIVFFASIRRGVIDRFGLLLVGVVLSTINGAGILLLNRLAGRSGLRDHLMNWMMGVLPQRSLGLEDGVAASVCAIALFWLFVQGKAMDIGTLDDDEASALGVRISLLKLALLITASVLTASAVLIAGPIAFVGLIAPHVGRLLMGPAHRPLLIAATILGTVLLVVADTASDAIAYALPSVGRLPVGIFTAVLGGPMFLWLLRPQLGRGME